MKANEIIKMRRKDLGLTMKEVAKAVGVSEATVSRWESGDIRNMRRDRISALSRVLDVPPAVLMDWEEFDEEVAERKKLTKELTNLCNVADIEHLLIAIDLIKRLEGMT
jgi:transcriptional regulator with XRE-family HTH domain